MIKETVTMSHKELHRLQIIQESINRHITQEQAAARIGISIRQVKRLVQRYRNCPFYTSNAADELTRSALGVFSGYSEHDLRTAVLYPRLSEYSRP
ncbi:helix-turn-helix domain-containing protein, partial [Cronobacter sakazakii]|uniref:helix-turn-helix domain-containing protein n=1 Tax=Cronobacter sakazakii TaxID=28141 RepID=UPI0021570704